MDALIDFDQFDRWNFTRDQPYCLEPEGWVDMTFMIYRNVAEDLPSPAATMRDTLKFYGGTASLGYTWYVASSPDNFPVDHGRRRFGSGWPGIGNSVRATTSGIG